MSPGRIFFRFLLIVALVYVGLSLAVAVPFSNILFRPPASPEGVPSLTTSESDTIRESWVRQDSLHVDAVAIASTAGPKPITLSTWWVYRDSPQGKPTVVFMAGNGGLDPANLEDKVRFLTGLGFNCALLDQRGYGASAGELLSHGWFEREDFGAVVDTLTHRYGMDQDRIGIWGISMGASNAVAIAASRPEIRAALLYAPWSNPQAMAVHYIWRSYSVPKALLQFPVWAAMRMGTWRNKGHILDPAEEAKNVRCPALVVYGDADDITAPELTERLFRSLAGPKEQEVIPGAHHNDLLEVMGPARSLEQMRKIFGPLLVTPTRS